MKHIVGHSSFGACQSSLSIYLPNNDGLFPSLSSSLRQCCALDWTLASPAKNTPLEMSTNSDSEDMLHQLTIRCNPRFVISEFYFALLQAFSPLIGSKISLSTNIAVFILLKATIIVHATCNRY
jgi:hypothetical protein